MPGTSLRWVVILLSSFVWGVRRSSLVLESPVLLCSFPWMPIWSLLPSMRFPFIRGLCVATQFPGSSSGASRPRTLPLSLSACTVVLMALLLTAFPALVLPAAILRPRMVGCSSPALSVFLWTALEGLGH